MKKTKRTRLEPVLGIPVFYDPAMTDTLSESFCLGWLRRIYVGPNFFLLERRQQAAVLLHEAGHVKMRHLERRLAYALANFWRPAAVSRYCRSQEFAADAYAVGCGYGRDFALMLSLLDTREGPFHPSPRARIERILGSLRDAARC